jgi:NitT/TauT family transport system ATP-binding protein
LLPGSRLAVLGPSGSGKTSFLRIVAGLLRPSTGAVAHSEGRPRIGMLTQDDGALPWRTVWRNLLLVRDEHVGDAELISILLSVGLPAPVYGQRLPSQLSGGERRRLGLAMVLASRPQLALLDEASSSLDERTRFMIVDEVLRSMENISAGLLTITHDVEEALLLGRELLIFDGIGGVAVRGVPLPPQRTSALRFTAQFQALRAEIVAEIRG